MRSWFHFCPTKAPSTVSSQPSKCTAFDLIRISSLRGKSLNAISYESKVKMKAHPSIYRGRIGQARLAVFVLGVDIESCQCKMDGEVKWVTQRAERCMVVHMEWDGMTDERITESHWSLACHCWEGSRNSQAGQSQLTSSLLQTDYRDITWKEQLDMPPTWRQFGLLWLSRLELVWGTSAKVQI